jgi:hypothetical protein
MTHRALLVIAVAFAALAAACGPTSDPAPAGLVVSVEPPSAVANGNTMVLVTVSGSIQLPLALSTTVGYWVQPGAPSQSISITQAGVNSAYLTTCDSRIYVGCTGVAQVRASDGKLSEGVNNVTFLQAF